MDDIGSRFREYVALDRKRADWGLTPVELHRWQKLQGLLFREFSGEGRPAEQRRSMRVPLRLSVSFGDSGELGDALMTNLSRGGVFVATGHPAEIGTRLELRIHLRDSGEVLEVPVEVVSVNSGANLLERQRGMGLRFLELDGDARARVDSLYERRLERVVRPLTRRSA